MMAVREVGREAVRKAGAILLEGYSREIRISFKGEIDLVTEVDWASEKEIIRVIHDSFPEHGILGEEGGSLPGPGSERWIIDPLDGTTNYTHHFPFFGISIGFESSGEILYGIVFDPLRNQTFEAIKGEGATLNGTRIHVSRTPLLSKSLLATGFSSSQPQNPERDNLPFFNRFSRKVQGIRRTGSAALDLCYVAMGALDGFWEIGLSPWDTAAGGLIVREAGGRVSNREDGKHELASPMIVASNGNIHPEMIALLNELKC
ncbi:MAG: inositol monophosphatase family protein [Leptospirales bacterium]